MGDWRQSGLNTMMTCPERFRRQYLNNEYSGNSAATLIGTSVHKAIELAMLDLRNNGHVPDHELVTEWAFYEFDRQVRIDRDSPDPIPWRDEETKNERRMEAATLANVWVDKSLDIVHRYGMPDLIEQRFDKLPMDGYGEITLSGTMDMTTDQHVLIDWKTALRNWKPGKANKQIQAIFYAVAYEKLTGHWPKQFVFIVMTRNNPRVYEHVVPLPRDKEKLLDKLLIEYDLQVEAGIFPLNTASNLCSVDYCPFWDSCPASLLEAA